MLIIPRTTNKQIVIGNHSIITVVSAQNGEAELGFETRDPVRRADSPEMIVEAAGIRARILSAYQHRGKSMEHPSVWVGHRKFHTDEVDVRASLRREMVDIVGYRIVEVSDETNLAPANHEFLVLRTYDEREVETLRTLIEAKVINWRYYEQMTGADSSCYALFVHATKNKVGGDVRYVDLAPT